MKFCVFGGAGFVGRHLVQRLRSQGHDVFVPERDRDDWRHQRLGHVVYCIGLTADFRTRPFDTMTAHVSKLADVLQLAQFESFVYLSSTRVYAKSTVASEDAAVTIDVSDPSDLYNISKLAGESLCLSCGRSAVKIARLSNVVGSDSSPSDFLQSLMRAALSGRILVESNVGSAKDYILLEDVLSLLPRIALEGTASIYNVASGINLAHGAILDRLAKLTNCSVAVRGGGPLIVFPPIDISRIKREFAFVAQSVLDQLPKTFASFAGNGSPGTNP